MKITLMMLVFIVMTTGISAVDININLIEYRPDSYYSRIHISNEYSEDLTGIKIKIDGSEEIPVVDLLKKGNIVYAVMNVRPGEHTVIVTSNEGVSDSKTLYFSQTREGVEKELKSKSEAVEKERKLSELARINLEESQQEINQEKERAISLGVVKERDNKLLIYIIITLLAGIGVMYWLIKKSNGNRR